MGEKGNGCWGQGKRVELPAIGLSIYGEEVPINAYYGPEMKERRRKENF